MTINLTQSTKPHTTLFGYQYSTLIYYIQVLLTKLKSPNNVISHHLISDFSISDWWIAGTSSEKD